MSYLYQRTRRHFFPLSLSLLDCIGVLSVSMHVQRFLYFTRTHFVTVEQRVRVCKRRFDDENSGVTVERDTLRARGSIF